MYRIVYENDCKEYSISFINLPTVKEIEEKIGEDSYILRIYKED